jgi:Bacterial SH3 domain
LKEFLKKYAYNAVELTATGSQGPPTQYIDTNTPESIKRNGNIYLWKVRTYILDGAISSRSFCGLQYRIKYDMYFRRGYASLDSVGYVSTKEGSDLRLRDGPSLDSGIIAGIPDKSKVFIIEYADKIEVVNGQSGNWCKIRYDGKTGWVWGYYITAKR